MACGTRKRAASASKIATCVGGIEVAEVLEDEVIVRLESLIPAEHLFRPRTDSGLGFQVKAKARGKRPASSRKRAASASTIATCLDDRKCESVRV